MGGQVQDGPGVPLAEGARREGCSLAPPGARRQPHDADAEAGGVHRRQGRGSVQAGHVPLLSAHGLSRFKIEARRIKDKLAYAASKTDAGVFWGWQAAERASAPPPPPPPPAGPAQTTRTNGASCWADHWRAGMPRSL